MYVRAPKAPQAFPESHGYVYTVWVFEPNLEACALLLTHLTMQSFCAQGMHRAQ